MFVFVCGVFPRQSVSGDVPYIGSIAFVPLTSMKWVPFEIHFWIHFGIDSGSILECILNVFYSPFELI